MLELSDVLGVMQSRYPMQFEHIEFNRDGGSMSYILQADNKKFFLRVIRPEFMDTALQSIDIHLYLSDNAFPVPAIIRTRDGAPYVRLGDKGRSNLYVMYDYIEGREPKSKDAESVGRRVGQFHKLMQGYTGKLADRDKHFFIDRYVHILRRKNYPRADVFDALGNALWDRIKNLPRGYCHGDLYRGNVHIAEDGTVYILDFDTSCNAFPMYDAVLFCNETDYFDFRNDSFNKTRTTLHKFLAGYAPFSTLSKAEIEASGDLIAVYHFQVQATVIEIYGLDCVDEEFIDKQLDWVQRWLELCEEKSWG